MSTGSLWVSGGCGLESMCCLMDWKEDTWELREEDEEWSVVEERESGVVVCNDAVDEATVDDGVVVDDDEDEEGLDECLLDWCLVERDELLEGVEDDVDGCL